ncbi:MAG: hypothetical protein KBE65_13350 [Phycisphaerae bacterium]|nr:hypothetical protein [Phycisphaerae bacterium]
MEPDDEGEYEPLVGYIALEQAGIAFEQRDNCFVWIEDLPRARQMMRDLEKRKWERWLKVLSVRVNPLLGPDSGLDLHPYYWSVCESEYATDVMFRDAPALAKVYPALGDHAIRRNAVGFQAERHAGCGCCGRTD